MQAGHPCPHLPTSYYGPWSVVLDNSSYLTEPQHWNTTGFNPIFASSAEIVFSVPDGTYSYTVLPQATFDTSGNVTVQGSDQVVTVGYNGIPVLSCPAYTATTTT